MATYIASLWSHLLCRCYMELTGTLSGCRGTLAFTLWTCLTRGKLAESLACHATRLLSFSTTVVVLRLTSSTNWQTGGSGERHVTRSSDDLLHWLFSIEQYISLNIWSVSNTLILHIGCSKWDANRRQCFKVEVLSLLLHLPCNVLLHTSISDVSC